MAPTVLRFLLALLPVSQLALAAPAVMEPRQVVGAVGGLVGSAAGGGLTGPSSPPSQDAFYQPPAGYESAAPGDILNHRQIAVPTVLDAVATGLAASAWQILFRSNDSSGNPSAVVTTLFVPAKGDPNKFFTQAVAYDAADVDCSPSYVLRTLTDTNPDIAVIALALFSGWYVQSPDFESYKAAFADGIVAGQGMLDSLRASLKSQSFTGLEPTARVALNGGSGGALACEWALELQPTYAPELAIAGATLGSLTPNVADVYNTINGGVFAGLSPTAIIGLSNSLPWFADYLDSNLVPSTAATFRKAGTQCLTNNQAMFAGQNISLYFDNPGFLTDTTPQDVLWSVGVMGMHGVPQVPIYVYKGANDEISSVDDTDALVDKYCSSGAPSVVYVRDIVTGHETESFLGLVGAYTYINDRLNGVPPYEGCAIINSTKSTFTLSDQTALGGLGGVVINILKAALPSDIKQ